MLTGRSRQIGDRRLESHALPTTLAIAVLGAVLIAPSSVHALTPRASCPLSTEVYPYPEQSLGFYEVQITDGGPGDVDSAIDSVCLFRTRVCLGSSRATPEPCEAARISSFSAKIRWQLDRSVRDATVDNAVEGVSRLFDGPESPGRTVNLETAPLARDHCVEVPVRVPAYASRGAQRKVHIAFTVSVTTAEGASVDYGSRLRLKCNPRPPSGRVRTRCRTYGGDCTDTPTLPPLSAGTTKTLQMTTTTTVWFEITKSSTPRRKTTTTSVPPSPSTTTSLPPPPTTTTTVPPTTTTSVAPPSTTSTTEPPPPTTTTTEPPPPTTTTSAPLPPTTTTTLAPPDEGLTFYLSPSGDDTNSGTSVASPWRTFDRVLNASKLLQPGDALVLLDGTYTRTTTGLPRIDCGTPGTANNGEPGRPITIRALNERQAHLQSDGLASAFKMSDCSWWIVQGLRASNADNPNGTQSQGYPFSFTQVSNVTGMRLLGSHNNRQWNTHVFAVELSQNVLLAECEAYYFHRHGFSIWRSRYVVLRRCYANSMLYGLKGCCGTIDNRNYGDEAFSLYGTSDSIVENSISENQANGFQIHCISSPLDPTGHGGRNNRILGSISLGDALPSIIDSRVSSGTYCNASGNVFKNFLAALGSGHGIFLRASADNHADNVTLYGSTANSGLIADAGSGNGSTCSRTLACAKTGTPCAGDSDCPNDVCTQNPEGCSFSARNALSVNNRVYGFRSSDQESWLVEYSNAAGNSSNYSPPETIDDTAGNIRSSMSTAPTAVGLDTGQCLAWIPASSNMAHAGADGGPVGANILFRYDSGNPTTEPLWDPVTRAFPCGVIVPGVNDGPTCCTNIHTRLGITGSGCQFPPGYGG